MKNWLAKSTEYPILSEELNKELYERNPEYNPRFKDGACRYCGYGYYDHVGPNAQCLFASTTFKPNYAMPDWKRQEVIEIALAALRRMDETDRYLFPERTEPWYVRFWRWLKAQV